VSVNDMVVGTIGSTTDMTLAAQSHGALHSFDLLPYLRPGANIISIRAANGNYGSCIRGASLLTRRAYLSPPEDGKAHAVR